MRCRSLLLPIVLAVAARTGVAQKLPTPAGPHPVGTSVSYLTDTTRRDLEFPQGRPVTVQLWYPAQRSNQPVAPYLMERALGDSLLRAQYYGMDSTTISAWRVVRTHSRIGAPAAEGRFPLVTFSVGQGVIRAQYTSLVEDLASNGYIVALVESPLQGFMVRPNGRVITDTAGLFGAPAGHVRGVSSWSRDISFALDRLAQDNRSIDWSKVGATGHSSGGVVAIQSCEDDKRVRACLDMDGGVSGPAQEPMAAFVPRGITKPALFLRSQPLYDDTTLARRGMTRAEWVKRGEGGRIGFDSLQRRSRAPLDVVYVAGTGHFSFSDAPFVMPTAITRFGGRIIAPTRGWEIITAVTRAYFDERLNGTRGALKAVISRYPELADNKLAR
jgi:dienelactone hydrolase